MIHSKRLLSSSLLALAVLFVSVFSFGGVVHAQELQVRPLSVNEQIIEQQSKQLGQKATVLQLTSQDISSLEAKKQALADQLTSEQQKIAGLKQQIANKKAAAAKAAEVKVTPVVYAAIPQGNVQYNCGDNYYAAYIYGNESGGHIVGNCNTGARNAGGCLGIGQACPGSKLLAVCPDLDYACENAFFTSYAGKYGGWAGAYQFWIANGWW